MWPVVETCWEAAQTWTDLYRRCYLQVSWWRVPYSKDLIRPVRRRRHRRPRRRTVLPLQSYLWHRSDATAYRQETIPEVGVDQSSRTTQRVCMFQRSYLYRAHLLCLRKVIPVRRWSPVCSIYQISAKKLFAYWCQDMEWYLKKFNRD